MTNQTQTKTTEIKTKITFAMIMQALGSFFLFGF